MKIDNSDASNSPTGMTLRIIHLELISKLQDLFLIGVISLNEYKRLKDMCESPDTENLTVARNIIHEYGNKK